MKKYLLVFTYFIFLSQLNAQILKTSDAIKIKERKLIVALKEYPKDASVEVITEIDSLNSYLKFAVKNYWNFNDVVDFLPDSAAFELMEKEKKAYSCIAIHETNVDEGLFRSRKFNVLALHSPYESIKCCLPIHSEKTNKTSVIYALTYINQVLSSLHEEKYTNMMWTYKYILNNRKNISTKILLIPKEYLDETVNEEWIKKNYPYTFEICSLERVEEIIVSKNSKYAVAYLLPVIITDPDHSNGTYRSIVFRINITNAENGDFYNVSNSGLGDALMDFKK